MAVCSLFAVMVAPAAHAQSRTFYLDRVHLSGAPDDGFLVWRPYMFEKTRFYGAWALGYSQNPLRVDNVTSDPGTKQVMENPLSNQLITYLSVGSELVNRLSVNLLVPVALFQAGGEDPQQFGVGGGLERNPVALHDLRLDARVRAFEVDDGTLRMGGGAAIWIATGDASSFTSDDQTTGYIYGSAEFDFRVFRIAGTIGPHFRPTRVIGGVNGDLQIGSDLRFIGGAYVPLRDDTLRIGGEVQLVTGISSEVNPTTGEEDSKFFDGQNTDIEWLGQIRLTLDKEKRAYVNAGAGTRLSNGYGAPDFRILANIGTYTTLFETEPAQVPRKRPRRTAMSDQAPDTDGDGFPDDIDMCPTVKEDGQPPNTDDGCPAPKDTDKDGLPDDVDKCPTDPEDKDGLEDHDGCPEDDVDNDQVPDIEDKCPTEPGPESKVAEKNGCPSLIKRKKGTDELTLLEPIEFETASARIKAVSLPILDEVVTLLKAQPKMRMGIYGHTDSRGAKAMNMKLSKDRAASVVTYIVSQGIDADRLESEGYGPDKPIDTNDTAEGRAKNRRVEFIVLDE